MNGVSERCPQCGAIPNWHLVFRRAIVRQLNAARDAGLPAPDLGPEVAWRCVYRHQAGKVCARFNAVYDFAPLALAPANDQMAPRPTVAVAVGSEEQYPDDFEPGDAFEGRLP